MQYVIKLIIINLLKIIGLVVYTITKPIQLLNNWLYRILLKDTVNKANKKKQAIKKSKELKAKNIKVLHDKKLKFEV